VTTLKQMGGYWGATAIILMMTLPPPLSAAPIASCEEAEKHSGTVKTWPALYSAFERYERCDDGVVAEGFDESVYNLLGKLNPAQLKLASELFAKSRGFEDFTLRHARSATVLGEQYDKAMQRLTTVCFRQDTHTCGALIDAAKSAEGIAD
jgi:hypothetical protein